MRKILMIFTLMATLFATTATTATAANLGDYNGSGIRIRSAPAGGTVLGYGYKGQGVCTYYWEWAGGAYWAYHRNLTTGVTGWSHQDLVSHYGTC